MTPVSRRQFMAIAGAGVTSLATAGAAVALPEALTKSAEAGAGAFDPLPFVNPEFRPLVGPLLALSAKPAIASLEALQAARNSPLFPSPPPSAITPWESRTVPGPAGNPDVQIYVINAGQKDKPRPAILDIHGGGFIVGTARSTIASLQEIAHTLDCVIVTVEYRLAPETRFPGSLEDNYAALKWLYAHAEELGADRGRIAVSGGSAGGGHAAMLAIAARDRGEVPLIFQALTYPMLDDRTGSTVHKPRQQGAIMWKPGSNRFGWSALLGVPAGSAHVPAGSVPARVKDLKGLPSTFIGVGSIDLFVDEDMTYAQRLLDAGVFVDLVVVPGGFHGFTLFKQTQVVQRYNDYYLGVLRQALST